MTPPAHLFFFPPKTIKKFLQNEGFEVVKIAARTGVAYNLLFSIFTALVYRLGFWDYLKRKDGERQVANKQGLEKVSSNNIRVINILNFPFKLLEFILNKFNMGPELLVWAKLKK